MWYIMPGSTKHYPLTIQRVKEIQRLNARGESVDELQPVELVSSKITEPEHAFVDVVGQVSLRSLEKTSRRRKEKEDNNRQQEQRKQQKPEQRNPNPNRPEQRGGTKPNPNPKFQPSKKPPQRPPHQDKK